MLKPQQARRLHPGQRWLLSLLGAALASLLVTACFLEPEPKGFGTHRQLGLPSCTVLALLKIPCPTCGMTTAWAHCVRGEFSDSLRANAVGMLLALAAIPAAGWAFLSAARGDWWPVSPRLDVLGAGGFAVLFIALLQWSWRVWGF